MTIEDRFQITISTNVPGQSALSICETCGAVVPKNSLSLAGYAAMDCRQIHHDWHEKLKRNEQTLNQIPPKNWEFHK